MPKMKSRRGATKRFKVAGSGRINVIIYEVKYGDTLASIAEKFGISVSEIVRINQLTNPLIYLL